DLTRRAAVCYTSPAKGHTNDETALMPGPGERRPRGRCVPPHRPIELAVQRRRQRELARRRATEREISRAALAVLFQTAEVGGRPHARGADAGRQPIRA